MRSQDQLRIKVCYQVLTEAQSGYISRLEVGLSKAMTQLTKVATPIPVVQIDLQPKTPVPVADSLSSVEVSIESI